MGLKPRSSFKSWAFVALDPFEDLLLGPAFGAAKVWTGCFVFVCPDVFVCVYMYVAQRLFFHDCIALFISCKILSSGCCSWNACDRFSLAPSIGGLP